MQAKARTLEFEGIPVSDNGDFHWLVDRETFAKVTGRSPESDDISGRGKFCCILYPAQTAAPLRVNRRVRVKLIVSPV